MTGVVCILCLIYLLFRKKTEALLDPRTIILIYYLSFWGKVYDLELDYYCEFLMLFSFLLFYGTVCFFYRLDLPFCKVIVNLFPFAKSKKLGRPIHTSTVLKIYVFVALTIILYIVYYASILGSVEHALIRFYARGSDSEIQSIYVTLLSYMLTLSALGLCVINYSNRRFQKKNSPVYYLMFFGILLVSFSSGTRGRLLFPIVLIIISEIFISIKTHISIFRTVFRISNIFLMVIYFLLTLFLTEYRGKYYESSDDVVNDLLAADYIDRSDADTDTKMAEEKDLIMSDYYYTVETFSQREDYLSLFSTLYSVCVNPIPRALWPEKPVGFGKKLSAIKTGINYNDDAFIALNCVASFAAGIHGEGFANEGILGVVFYSILLGIISGIIANIYRLFFQYDTLSSLLLCLLLLRAPACYVRGDILTGISQQIFPIIGLCLLMFLLKPFFSTSQAITQGKSI